MPMSLPLPLRVSEHVTRREDGAETSVHLPLPLPLALTHSTPSISSTFSNASSTSIQHSRSSDQSAARTDTPSSSSLNPKSTTHFHNSASFIITPVAHVTQSSWSENRNVRRPTSSPSPSTSSQFGSTPPFLSKASYFSPQPGASGIDLRTTPIRRQPASRSSHGIETLSGPPPALSTQRSYTTEISRRQPSPAELIATRPHLKPRSKTELKTNAVIQSTKLPTNNIQSVDPSKAATEPIQGRARKEGKMTARVHQYQKESSFDDDQDNTIRNLEGIRSSAEMSDSSSYRADQSKSSNEDLFLNLARADASMEETGDATSKSKRRRSRISTLNPPHPHTSLSTSNRLLSNGTLVSGHPVSSNNGSASFHWSPSVQSADFSSPLFAKSLASKDRVYAATAHPLDRDTRSLLHSNVPLHSSRPRSGSNRETSPESHIQRQSPYETSLGPGTRAYKQSNLSYSNGQYISSTSTRPPDLNTDPRRRPQTHGEDTESTVSTTAASNIWDDVEDLKERMLKMEMAGKSPSAVIPNAYGERPPTVSTTVTTMSSSPKHRRVASISPENSTIKGPEAAQLHPLLHSALARSKPVISRAIYSVLEATALDALNLAAMTGSVAGLQDSTPASGIDRQLRRKADSMCRSLTELCIALTTEKLDMEPQKPQSPQVKRDRSVSLHQSIENVHEPKYPRAASEDPGIRPTSRVLSRIEARRASMQISNSGHTQPDPSQDINRPIASTSPANRLDRTSPGRRRYAREEDGVNNSTRPASRAMTEIAHIRPSPSSRGLHEYTSQHPLPSPTQRSPSIQSSVPVRRSRLSLSSQLPPLTPTILPGNKRYPDHATPPGSADSARLAELRQQRIASLMYSKSAGLDGSEVQAEVGAGAVEAAAPSG